MTQGDGVSHYRRIALCRLDARVYVDIRKSRHCASWCQCRIDYEDVSEGICCQPFLGVAVRQAMSGPTIITSGAVAVHGAGVWAKEVQVNSIGGGGATDHGIFRWHDLHLCLGTRLQKPRPALRRLRIYPLSTSISESALLAPGFMPRSSHHAFHEANSCPIGVKALGPPSSMQSSSHCW